MIALKRQHNEPDDEFDPDFFHYLHFSSREETEELFNREAMAILGIPGDEFIKRWDAGEYKSVPDTFEGRKIGRLAMLMPFARK